MYYRGAQAAIVVFDITKPETFERAKAWVKELQRQASPNIVIALAGNKADLAEKRLVEYEVTRSQLPEMFSIFFSIHIYIRKILAQRTHCFKIFYTSCQDRVHQCSRASPLLVLVSVVSDCPVEK
ncbi:hypothetical protein ILYODFUR_016134 [Ilyodon furcidens]|uniref:Uncharacterized protein n=1 Tax=Ilyodon furcidens TaxID=33524 RepID=A0ABV0U5S4_9TELE